MRARHVAFSNLTAANAWQPVQGSYAIRTAGGSESLSTGYVMSGAVFSLSLWFRRASAGAFVSVGAHDSTTRRFGLDAYSDGVLYLEVADGANSFGSLTSNDTLLHHLVMLYDGTQATNATWLRAYLDGTERSLTYGSTIPATLSIGVSLNLCSFSTRVTSGDVDDVRLYDRTLNATEIRTLSSRRGIAYELAPRRRSSVQVAAFNRRRRLLVGAGS